MGRPLLFKTVEELEEKIQEYFNYRESNNLPFTISSLAVYLNCDRDTLLNYENKEEYFGTIKSAKQKIEAYAEDELFRTSGNTAGVIFNLKNNYGWKDKQEIDQTTKEDVTIKINLED